MIINNISGLPRVSPTKLWWCSGGLIINIYSYFTIIWISTLYKVLLHSPSVCICIFTSNCRMRGSRNAAQGVLVISG